MPLVHVMWTTISKLLLPALALAFCVAWFSLANAQTTGETTKLFRAVEVNDMGAVKAALAAGADLSAKNAAGKTAADVAVDKGHFIIAHFLLSERSSRSAAAQSSAGPSTDPKDRLRKPSDPAPRRLIGRKTAPVSEPEATAGNEVEILPDSKTRVTAELEPATAPSKPKPKTEKTAKYGFPPRKPPAPAPGAAPITREIVVLKSPGVKTPSGDEPTGAPSRRPPVALTESPRPDTPLPVPRQTAEAAKAPSPRSSTQSPKQAANDPDTGPLETVGNFFKSLVDLVNPLAEPEPSPPSRTAERTGQKEPRSPERAAPAAPAASAAPPASVAAPTANGWDATISDPGGEDRLDDDLMMAESLEPVENGSIEDLGGPDTEGELNSDLADELLAPELTEDEGPEGLPDERPQTVVEAPKSTASARTLDRIKSLLGEEPEENEFGLPEVEIPTRETVDLNATDDVLDQLAETDDASNGFLDDRPGPETGPGRDFIEDERPQLPASAALRERLRRLNEAVTREIEVDTNEILRQGRTRAADPLYQPTEKRATTPRPLSSSPDTGRPDVPRPLSSRSRDQMLERAMRPENQLTRRSTPATRFAERLDRIQQEEALAEADRLRRLRESADPEKSASEEPGLLDKMARFFGSEPDVKKRPEAASVVPEAPPYRGSPSTREPEPEGPAPEIDNLEAFDQEDETAPKQAPGSLEPVFLNRLASLFNEEEEKQADGWKAKIETENPFPGRGELVQKTGGNVWTTTVEMNVGDGKDPVVVQVAQTPDEGLETLLPEPDGSSVSQTAQRGSQASGGKAREMAKQPYGDPLRAPEKQQEAEKKKTFYSRLTRLFQPKDPVELKRDSLLLEPDEKLSTAHDAMDGGVRVATRTEGEAKNYWPITSLTKADPPASPPRRPGALTRTSLTDVTLTLGESVSLENLFPPGRDGIDPNNECVKKNRGTTLFCIEPIDWPADLQQSFIITTILYTGSMAIVRYDQTAASRLHTLFGSDDFEKVASYYQNKFGEPTEILKRSIAPLAKPRQDNPTISWRSKDSKTNAITVLEIRKYDDTRGGFPDTNRGAVMLYYSTSPSIFPQVSSHELMRLKRIGDITQSEAERNAALGDESIPVDEGAPPPPGGAAVSEDELFGSEPLPEPITDGATDATLEALPDSEPALTEPDGLFERPEDILNEPALSEPSLSEPDLLSPDLMEPQLSQPERLDPSLPEPDLLAPSVQTLPDVPQGGLFDEPLTDEPPDEIIEIPASQLPNPS